MRLQEDFRTWGGVHTASYFVADDVRPNESTRLIVTDYRRTNRDGSAGTAFKFNPNKGIHGECISLSAYLDLFGNCCDALGIEAAPELTRIDFRVDCIADTPEQYQYWRKLGEWAVHCFAYMKHVKPRNEGRTVSITTGRHEATRAATDGYELVCYNKALQKPDEGVGYRFEIRHRPHDGSDEAEALRKLCRLLKRLPEYAELTAEAQNTKLMELWKASAPSGGTPSKISRKANEFISAHEHDIFTVQQLERFYQLIGYSKEQAKHAKRNYCNRYGNVFVPVTQKALKAFCDMAVDYIEQYITESTAASKTA